MTVACAPSDDRSAHDRELVPYTATDSMGAMPIGVRVIAVSARPDLREGSAAVMSDLERDILFTVNDSGNDALLFALDTTGHDRGVWRITGATNVDWEAASLGPCASTVALAPAMSSQQCLYIGDVGDNARLRPAVTLYRVSEPTGQAAGFSGTLLPEQLTFHFPDASHDVEAIYVAPDGTTFLITKRRLKDTNGQLRPALVFALDKSGWGSPNVQVASLVDSLPITPGTDALRLITDASLSRDARSLAVRTYGQVYIFATDSLTARVRHSIPPAVCNIALTEQEHGEGLTWFGSANQLLLTSEGVNAPLHVINCPMPAR